MTQTIVSSPYPHPALLAIAAFAGTGSSPGGRREIPPKALRLPRQHQLLDLADSLGRVQPLRTGERAAHDRVAAVVLERILWAIGSGTGRERGCQEVYI